MRAALGARVELLRSRVPGIGWVATDNLHITLKFLGYVEESRLEEIGVALGGAATAVVPFKLAVEGLGAFPSITRPRVVWAGVSEGRELLTALAARVERALALVGFGPEDRLFSPHITLGRVREPRRDLRLAAALEVSADATFGRGDVRHVSLMRSDLSPRGARYTELVSAPLGRS